MKKLMLIGILGLLTVSSQGFGALDQSKVAITVYHMELSRSQFQERKIIAATAKYFLARVKSFRITRPFIASGIQPGTTVICVDFARHLSIAGSYVKYIRSLFTGGYNFTITQGRCFN